MRRRAKDQHMTKTKDEPEMDETPTHHASLASIGKKIDAAVKDADEKRLAVAAAQTALDTANADLAALMQTIQTLAQEQKTVMDEIMTLGGTVHAANG
jgi:hypothetical protein